MGEALDGISQNAELFIDHGAAHILLAGDTFDQMTPAPAVIRQAMNAMAAAAHVQWGVMPGNHDHANATELWRQVEAWKPEIVIMYQHVSCKTMSTLSGLFDEEARARGIHMIWVEHDLMDPRTVSRRSMRSKVNNYMTAVMREEPLDPSLLEFEDDATW